MRCTVSVIHTATAVESESPVCKNYSLEYDLNNNLNCAPIIYILTQYSDAVNNILKVSDCFFF